MHLTFFINIIMLPVLHDLLDLYIYYYLVSEHKCQKTQKCYFYNNTPHTPGADPEGGFGDLPPLNFLEVKII